MENERKEGSFIELLRNFLDRERIDYSFEKYIKTVTISVDRKHIIFTEEKEECNVIKYIIIDGFERIDIESSMWRYVPITKRDLISFTKKKYSKDLEMLTSMTIYEPPLDAKGVMAGEIFEKVIIKNILKEPSKTEETFHIVCRCDSKRLKCEGITGAYVLEKF